MTNDLQQARISTEVLDEYRKIVAWLEAQAALRGAVGDTMHGLAAEALTELIERERTVIDYTPTTEEVRNRYISEVFPEDDAEFDRWLALVKAEAWDEGFNAGEDEAYEHEARLQWSMGHACTKNPYREETVTAEQVAMDILGAQPVMDDAPF